MSLLGLQTNRCEQANRGRKRRTLKCAELSQRDLRQKVERGTHRKFEDVDSSRFLSVNIANTLAHQNASSEGEHSRMWRKIEGQFCRYAKTRNRWRSDEAATGHIRGSALHEKR